MGQGAGSMALERVLSGGRRVPFLRFFLVMAREKPLAAFGAFWVFAFIVLAIFAGQLAPFPYDEMVDRILLPPSRRHLLGTDDLGRDVLSRIIYGARISLTVGLGATAIGITLATVIGSITGYLRSWLDDIFQRIVDAWMSFPPLIILLTMMVFFGSGVLNITLALGINMAITQSRVVRGTVLSLKEEAYVDAAQAIGCSHPRILLRHILPNTIAPVIIVATANLASMILIEATLSFLGYGIPPPFPSWGSMISGPGRQHLYEAPWIGFAPGAVLSLAVFGWNVLGDGLRDLLDPRLRGAGRHR